MMAVMIEDKDVPKNCAHCWHHYNCNYYKRDYLMLEKYADYKPDNCPLHEVDKDKMTIDEARQKISNIKIDDDGDFEPLHSWYKGIGKDYRQALDIAIRSLEAWEKVLDELRIYGSICVSYVIKGNTEKDIEDIVSSVLKQEKSAILHIIDEHLKEVTDDENRT